MEFMINTVMKKNGSMLEGRKIVYSYDELRELEESFWNVCRAYDIEGDFLINQITKRGKGNE